MGTAERHATSSISVEGQRSYVRVVLKVLVCDSYLGDHFSWFERLAKLSRKKTRKDYIFIAKDVCDSGASVQ